MSFVSLLVLGAGLAFQAPPTVQTSDGFRTSSPNTPANPALTPELRGDIMMARKMFREAIDFYKPGAEKSAILANKTGIAYHQLQDLQERREVLPARGQAESEVSRSHQQSGNRLLREEVLPARDQSVQGTRCASRPIPLRSSATWEPRISRANSMRRR